MRLAWSHVNLRGPVAEPRGNFTSHARSDKPRCRLQAAREADTLELQTAAGYWVRAYLRAADTVHTLNEPLDELRSKGGMKALDALPGIRRGIASAITEMLSTGRWSKVERLQGLLEPESLFQTLLGNGPVDWGDR